jgi:serine/threonine-protein phosphatase 4 regulatory subunit 1
MDTKNGDSISTKIAQEEVFLKSNTATRDQNEVFIEYSPAALDKLLNLSNNNNYQEKLQYIKHLAELLTFLGEDGINKLAQIVNPLLNENEETKKALLSQISPTVSFLRTRGEKGYQEIIQYIVPTLAKLITSQQLEIKEESGNEMGKLAYILNEDDRGKHLLTIVLVMAHDEENEDNKLVAVQLLSKMAPLFGKDLCEQFVGLEFLSLGDDPSLRVRKEAVTHLSSVGKIVSVSFFKNRLLPFYLRSCKDVNWGVRKSCVDSIVEMAKISDNETKETELVERELEFMKDSSKWVKISAYKSLGPFISTLAGLKINEKLLENYLHMTDSSINSMAPENEIVSACAYNFPAVLYTLGPQRWGNLSKLFQSLLKNEAKVKIPLACALHELASMIGEEKADTELFPVLKSLLKDQNDDVRYGVIKNLALFMKVFNPEKRENMVDMFLELQKDQKKWRVRELIARQIDKLADIYSTETVFKIIAPISFKLCGDNVAIVRKQASKKVHAILKTLYNVNPQYRACIVENIVGFSSSTRYTHRQSFIQMTDKLMDTKEAFKEYFMKPLVTLATDKVTNVRICLAKIIKKKLKQQSEIIDEIDFKIILETLKNDKSIDVRSELDMHGIKLLPKSVITSVTSIMEDTTNNSNANEEDASPSAMSKEQSKNVVSSAHALESNVVGGAITMEEIPNAVSSALEEVMKAVSSEIGSVQPNNDVIEAPVSMVVEVAANNNLIDEAPIMTEEAAQHADSNKMEETS